MTVYFIRSGIVFAVIFGYNLTELMNLEGD